MSIGNAIKFMKKTESDFSFRKGLYKLEGVEDFKKFQILEGLEFSDFEFEEAFNYLHTNCQFAEQADRLFNVKHLFELIIRSTK